MRFSCRLGQTNGREIESVIEARDLEGLRAHVTATGFYLLDARATDDDPSLFERAAHAWENHAARRELLPFTRLLSTLIRSGVPVVEALTILAEESDSPAFGRRLFDIRDRVASGASLSQALAMDPELFPEFVHRSIAAGESAGAVPDVLARITQFLGKRAAIARKVQVALIYPAVLSAVAVLGGIGMLVFLMPQFEVVFQDRGVVPPDYTRFVFWLSAFFSEFWYALLLLAALAPVGVAMLLQRPEVRRAVERVSLRVPKYGTLLRQSAHSVFCRTLATVIEGGVPVYDALGIALGSVNILPVREELEAVAIEVERGTSLGEAFRAVPNLPRAVTRMVAVGEETGELPALLFSMADWIDEEVDATAAALTALVEPAIMIVIALFIGGLLVTVAVPLFSIAMTGVQ